jgi:hypothetical protein
MRRIANTYADGLIVKNEIPRHGSPQDRGSADAYYGRPYDPHYYVGDSLQSTRVEKCDMTDSMIEAYRYGYDNEEDRKEW